ncbi:BamA/TamA family outer membrane protein [Verrucomicrobiaceae bacterium E54]|nr:BamA/TamA family outer membrane protein [Verrucomicrobiaceae bacterium E54]
MTRGEQIIAWQTVLGIPVSSLHAHALSWEIPLHRLQQTLQIDAAYARVENRTPSAVGILDNEGTSWSVAMGHRMILPRLGRWKQEFTSGFELKATDQFVLFGGGAFSPGEVRLLHGKLSYRAERRWDDAGVVLAASLLASPGGLVDGNDDADFRAYDPRADSSYVLGRLSGQGWWSPGGDWRLGLRGAAQWADSRLLPSEQFAAGGYRSVRGIGEREFIADGGVQGSFEVVSPEWRGGDQVRVRGVGFFDHAWLRNDGGATTSVSGAGVGIRMRVSEYVDLWADHGWWLDGRGSRTHFGVTMRY